MSEFDFINDQWNKELNLFREDYNKWEKHTLKEHIKKLADIVEMQIDHGLLSIDKQDVSTHIYKELKKQEIEVSDRTVRRSLPPDFKHSEKSRSFADTMSSSHEPIWEVISSPESPILVEHDRINNLTRIDGVLQQSRREPRETDKEIYEINVHEFKDAIYDTIMNEYQAANTWAAYYKAMGEYYLDFKTAPLIIENLKKTKKRTPEQKEKEIQEYKKREEVSKVLNPGISEHWKNELENSIKHIAEAKTVRNEVDRREKWGYFSKLWQFYIAKMESKANLAELVGYCSKYASIGIERNPVVEKFYSKMLSCPSCEADIHRAMNAIIEEDIRREQANLPGLLVPKIPHP